MLTRLSQWTEKMSAQVAHWLGDTSPPGLPRTGANPNALPDHHFLSALLPYETFDPETSLFLNKKSLGFILEVNPLVGSSEEIEAILTSLLTDILPAGVDLQFLLWASPKIGPVLDAFESARSINAQFAWLARQRTDYLKQGAYEGLGGNSALVLRHFRLLLVVSQAMKKEDHRAELVGLRDDLQSSLRSINLESRSLNAQGFLTIFSDIITPSTELYPTEVPVNPWDSLSLQLTDPQWRVRVHPEKLCFIREDQTIEARCLTVREFPEKATQWKVTENLGQLFNTHLHIPCPFLVSFSLRKIDQEKARTDAHLKFRHRESNAKSPLASFKPSINNEYHDWHFIRQRLGEGDCLVKTYYQVILFTPPDKANRDERRVRDLYRANGWKLKKESFLQLQSWLAALPMLLSEGLYEDLQRFGRLKTMTGFNAISIAPLQGEWQGTSSPSLLLPGRRGQVALWNPFDNEGNFNMAIMAAPRKGKSAFTQEYIVSILGAGGRVWVIDAGRSYEKTCKVLGGQFIEFTHTTQLCLNPFTTITDIHESMVMLKPLLASMARPVRGASEEELTAIEQAIKAAWEAKGNKATITTVAQWLLAQDALLCQNLSHLLFSYTQDGVYARFFEGPCTIDFDHAFIVMELQELKAKKDLQRIVLQVLMYLISQAMYLTGRAQMKSCIIDEAWDLLDSDDVATAKFIEAGYRTAPKFRGNFVAIAHSMADFHRNAMSRAAFDCADFKIILGQTEEAINKLTQEKIMDMDGFKERLFKSLKITKEYSECVIKGPEGLSVHRIIFDPYSRILYSTKGEEFDAVNQLVNQGVALTAAIEQVARQFHHV